MTTSGSSDRAPRKRLPAAERRELIERAALELFAERGYHGTAIDEIARRGGVSPPVLYDHFASKLHLHLHLLERTRDELLDMWRTSLRGGDTLEERVARSFAAWAAYVRTHPYAPRMFFRETTGDPVIRQAHDEIAAVAHAALAGIVGGISGSPVDDASDAALIMTTEVIHGGLTGLAIWWADHPEVPDEAIVATAMNTVWIGFDRVSRGEAWSPPG